MQHGLVVGTDGGGSGDGGRRREDVDVGGGDGNGGRWQWWFVLVVVDVKCSAKNESAVVLKVPVAASVHNFNSHLLPRLCPSTTGCIPPTMPSIVFCLMLYSFRVVSLLLCCGVLPFSAGPSPLFLPFPLVVTLCSVWSI